MLKNVGFVSRTHALSEARIRTNDYGYDEVHRVHSESQLELKQTLSEVV